MARKTFEISFNIAGKLGSSFRATFGSAASQMDRLKTAARELKSSLRSLESDYKKGALSVSEYRVSHERLTQQLERTERAQKRLESLQRRQRELQQESADIRGQIMDTAAVSAPFVMMTKSAMDFEKSMLGVAKQVEGARDESGKLTKVYYEMRDEIFKMGREMGIPNEQLAELMAFSAKMGVPRKHLVAFTKDVAKMGEAFEMLPEEIGTSMGQLANLFKIPYQQISDLGDVINYLDDKSLASGRDIIGVMLRAAGQAKAVNMTEKQLAALSSTFLNLGKSEEVAGTAINGMLSKLAAAQQQPKAFQRALKKLGLTSKDVTKGMARDAQGTILKVLERINKLKPEERVGVTIDLFGLEYGDDVATLAAGIEEYRKQIALVNDEKAKGSMSREFEARNQTSYAQLEKLKNSAKEMSANVGDIVLPTLNQIFEAGAKATQKIAELAKEYPNATKVIVAATAGLVTARLGWLALRLSINSVARSINAIKKVAGKATAGWLTKSSKAPKTTPTASGTTKKTTLTVVDSRNARTTKVAAQSSQTAKGTIVKFPKQANTMTRTFSKATGTLSKVGKVLGKAALPLTIATEAYAIAKSNDKKKAVVQSAGGIAGGLAGAKIGAAIGTAIAPGIGTAIGSFLGGISGYALGKWGTGKAVDTARGYKASKTAGMAGATPNAQMQGAIQKAARNFELLSHYTAQIISQIVGAGLPLSSNIKMAAHNFNLLTHYSAQVIVGLVGSGISLANGMRVSAFNAQLLSSYLGQASGWVVGAFFPLTGLSSAVKTNLSLLSSYLGQASGWIVGSFFPMVGSADVVKRNLSILSSYVGQASGWVASIYGIQSAADSVKSALNRLAARIDSVPAPRVSVFSGGKVQKHARGGIFRKPHIGMVAEAGKPESIIPIRPGDPRSLSLFEQTGRMLGVDSIFEKSKELKTSSFQQFKFTYAPVIQGVERREVEPILKRERSNFEEQMNSYLRKKARVSYS